MSLICPQCGAENRPHAKFCLKCAKQLVSLNPSADDAARAKRRRKRRQRKEAQARAAAAGTGISAARWMAPGALAAIVLIGVVGWMNRSTSVSEETFLADASVTNTPATPASLPETTATTAQGGPSHAAAVLTAAAAASAALNGSASDSAPISPTAQKPPDRTAAASDRVPPRQAPQPTRKVPERARTAAEPAEAAAPPSPVVATSAPPPPSIASAPSANALCADRAFIARAVCLESECAKPALRQHPQCVRMREQQETLRHGSGGG
jgi:hypothetical protein